MAQTESTYVEYPMFKGLQKPLEFLRLQGRYITWAAITAGTGILGFMLMFSLFGFLAGLGFAVVAISTGIGLILLKQKKGLHTKKEYKGILIYANLCKL